MKIATNTHAGPMLPRAAAEDHPILQRHRLGALELLPWIAALAVFYLAPGYLALGTQVLIMVLFALSLDLLLGYAGVVTLGHAVYFGIGAYAAGILSVHLELQEPLTGLLAAGALAGGIGLVTAAIILRTRGLTFLMLTLTILLMIAEGANKASFLTGGADGLQGITINPVLGLFRFDMFGRTGYLYALAVLFILFVFVRTLTFSAYGRSLIGIRENAARMEAVGAPVRQRLITVYGITAALAGVAGALNTQTTQFVALNVLSFELSGAVLTMIILGGTGRLYGAFVGAPLYMIAQDYLARLDPTYWFFWIGALLIIVVMFARGGVLGLIDRAAGILPGVRER
jgi:branched-chain amino acid transport system permease protein